MQELAAPALNAGLPILRTRDDSFVVDSLLDELLDETETSGTDTVVSSITWTLGPVFENLTLTGTANCT